MGFGPGVRDPFSAVRLLPFGVLSSVVRRSGSGVLGWGSWASVRGAGIPVYPDFLQCFARGHWISLWGGCVGARR